MQKICPSCCHANRSDALFCRYCGTNFNIFTFCLNCGKDNRPGARFCRHCSFDISSFSPENIYICPKCGEILDISNIIKNDYACTNHICDTDLVHSEIDDRGNIKSIYGWLLPRGMVVRPAGMLKGYQIEHLLGKGGFGATYLVIDLDLYGRERALKEVPEPLYDPKESEILSRLKHPGIPDIQGIFRCGNMIYIVMEKVGNENLADKVISAGPLAEQEILVLADEICSVLDYIHSEEPTIIHRDIKPANILIEKDYKISLIDFGISKEFIQSLLTRKMAKAASYGYSPPEQYGGSTDEKSDIYSFGATLYYLATAKIPTDAMLRVSGQRLEPLKLLNSNISRKLEQIILKAMELNPDNRFDSINQMRREIRKI